MKKQKVLLVGWDAADWKVIDSLIADGKLPFMAEWLKTAVRGDLATLYPAFSPMLWTSIATGKRPYKHGIHGFSEPTPDGQGVQPITNLGRHTKAIWNMLTQEGAKSNVVGWWPSHPAEPIDGVMVSNRYQRCTAGPGKEWPVVSGTVHPEELSDQMGEIRIRPDELLPEQIYFFMPQADRIDTSKDGRFRSCCSVIADSFNIHSSTTWLMENTEWDLMAVYYDAIDHFGHGFQKFHPPQQEFVSDRDFDLYSNVVTAGYELHSLYLERLIELAGEDTLVVLISDHGFHPDHLRPAWLPNEPAGPASEHREYGILAMSGPGIKQGGTVGGCNLLDITPTILAALDLPVGEDMDGRVLVEAFQSPPDVRYVPSWDDVAGDCGMHPPDAKMDGFDSEESMAQLVALGYVDAPDEDKEVAVRKTVDENRYNLACSYMDGGRHADAEPILEDLSERYPDQYRYATQLAFVQQALGNLEKMRDTVDGLLTRRFQEAAKARKTISKLQTRMTIAREDAIVGYEDEGDAFFQKPEWSFETLMKLQEEQLAKQSLTDEQKEQVAKQRAVQEQQFRAMDPYQRIDAVLGQTCLTMKERRELQEAQQVTSVSEYPLEFLAACLCTAEGNGEQALDHLQRAERFEPNRPQLHLQFGEAHMVLEDYDAAKACYERVLELEPENAFAHLGISRLTYQQGDYMGAAKKALASIRLKYAVPQAHYCLAQALQKIGRAEPAVKACEIGLSINPFFPDAHELLAELHGELGNADQAAEHKAEAARQRQLKPEASAPVAPKEAVLPDVWIDDELTERGQDAVVPANADDDVITIVSGLPRSGTSMMMQMLTAGGIKPLTDGERAADEDNPEGYLELERVKNLHNDKGWVGDAKGKSVKVIAQLLPALPAHFKYRVVFMNRSIDEVLRSQRVMIDRGEMPGADVDDEKLKLTFDRQLRQVLRWAKEQKHVDLLVVNHRDAIEKPADVATRVATFLGDDVEEAKMASVVKPKLYRQRERAVASD